MAAILQTMFSNAFSWINIFEFQIQTKRAEIGKIVPIASITA